MKKRSSRVAPVLPRTNAFRQMLLERRQALQDEVAARVKAGRRGRPQEGGDGMEDSAADVEGDISLSLIQMQTETLTRIDQAMLRLDAGQYGLCAECGDEISEKRLMALPFAVRCQPCEQSREGVQGSIQKRAQQQGNFWHFANTAGS